MKKIDETQGQGVTRRRLLQVSGAGALTIAALGAGGRFGPAAAEAYETFTWISPRGTLEVLDDYGFWIAKKMGYFDDMDIKMEPGPSDGTATVKLVAVGQADMGFPSPGIFVFGLENGMDLKSVFHIAARDTFSFAFRKGEGTNDLKDLEGKTILLGSAAWQSITDPLLASQGVDVSKIKYVEAGWPTWGTALANGEGDAALAWEGLRAEWESTGLDFEYWLGVQNSSLPANSYVIRASDLEDPERREQLVKFLRGVSMGLEFAHHNPRAAVEAVFEEFPTLATNVGPELGTTSILQQINVNRGDWDNREGWGWHDMDGWQSLFDEMHKLEQVKSPIAAEDVLTNDLIAEINDFDHDKVKADADAYVLGDEMQAVDVEKIRANMFNSAIQ